MKNYIMIGIVILTVIILLEFGFGNSNNRNEMTIHRRLRGVYKEGMVNRATYNSISTAVIEKEKKYTKKYNDTLMCEEKQIIFLDYCIKYNDCQEWINEKRNGICN